jgi:hypothetical protein
LSYLALTDADREAMLETIGVSSVEGLFADLPAGVRLGRELDLRPALTEQELTAYFEALAAENAHVGTELSFLGAGMYDHYVPAIVDAVLQRGELLTAYTPYQPELSQGVLQAIFEYQTAICELTGWTSQRVRLRRHHGRRRRVLRREARDGPLEGRRHRGDQPAGAAGREDLRARLRARGRRGAASGRRDRPGGARRGRGRRGLRDLPAAELLRRARAGPDLAAAANEAEALAVAHVDPISLGCSKLRQLRLRDRHRRGAGGGATTSPTAGRTTGSSPHASTSSAGCRDASSARPLTPRGARLCPHPPDARAAHQAREGDLQHHHQPDAAGAWRARLPLVARAGGAQGGGGGPASRSRSTRRSVSGATRVCRKDNIQGVCRSRRTTRAGGRPRGPRSRCPPRLRPRARLLGDGRRAAGRAHRERRTPEEIERLAETLAEVAA